MSLFVQAARQAGDQAGRQAGAGALTDIPEFEKGLKRRAVLLGPTIPFSLMSRRHIKLN